jgi:hypothetical protein
LRRSLLKTSLHRTIERTYLSWSDLCM